jgi:parallel beta-helix repeat protein
MPKRSGAAPFWVPAAPNVLDRDLTCPETPLPGSEWDYLERIGMIKLIGGATLNLNGHTVTCSSRTVVFNGMPTTTPTYGIVVRNSTLVNGTVRDCGYGVVTSQSLVKNVVFDGNTRGVSLQHKYGAGHNLIIGNTIRNSVEGVFVQESEGELLIDNTAENNKTAFIVRDLGGTFVGNTADGNDVGFDIIATEALIGNRAIRNRVGFKIDGAREAIGNIAKNNAEDGFSPVRTLDEARHNFAHRNGQDGFRLDLEGATFKKNYALGNRGVGIHVLSEGNPPSAPLKKLKRNISINNLGGDVADDDNCQWTNWVNNTFETAAQGCID